MSALILGCDPGLDGAFVALKDDGSFIKGWIMPVFELKKKKGGTKREIDLLSLRNIMREFKQSAGDLSIHLYLEQSSPMPGEGTVSSAKAGKGFGYIEAMVFCHDIPYSLVHPRKWTTRIHAGTSPDLDAKARSRQVVARLYPGLDLRATERCRNQHEGLVDALLIARYGSETLREVVA